MMTLLDETEARILKLREMMKGTLNSMENVEIDK